MDWLTNYLKKNNVTRVAYIMDAVTPRLQKEPDYIFKNKKMLEDRGFDIDFISLEETKYLGKRLEKAQAIYVTGGNTFYLLKAIRQSGFDKIISKLLDNGVIYIGESAGSYVACPTIAMAHWKHQDADTVGLNDLTALNLVPFLVTVHYKDEFEPIIRPKIDKCSYPVKILTDNQLLLIEKGKERLIEL